MGIEDGEFNFESNEVIEDFKPESSRVSEDDEVEGVTETVDSALISGLSFEDDEGGSGDDESDIQSAEERLSEFADTLISACFKGKTRQHALDTLLSVSSPGLFRNENYVLFSVILNFKGKIRSINIDEQFIKLYLARNRGMLDKARGFIDVNAYGEVDNSPELGYIAGVLKHYRRLLTLDDISEGDFDLTLEKYLIEFKAMEGERTLQNAQKILSDGMKIGRKDYFGFEDAENYVKRRMAEIEGLVDMRKGSGYTNARAMVLEQKSVKQQTKIGDFGGLKTLNEVYGGIYTGTMYEVVAPAKAGKSKMCTRAVHTCAVEYGNNVSVWAVEGGNDAFLAQLRAVHFDYFYNKTADISNMKTGVNQDTILHDKFESDELKDIEMSSALDLVTNEKYGSIDFIDRPFEVETFIEDIDTSVKSNNSLMVVIDYPQLITSSQGKSEREAVTEAYKKMLRYCREKNVAFFVPAQYKQETFDRLVDMKDLSSADMRTSGAVSSEVIRTPDIIFALWATTQDLREGSMKILSMPCRFNKPFPMLDVGVNFDSCSFTEISKI